MAPALHIEVFDKLNGLEFPTQAQPDAVLPNRDLACWGVNIYCYSVLAHLREILGSVEALRSTHPFLINLLTRNMHEWTAHAAYMNEHLAKMNSANDFASAWTLLSRSILGNRWLNGKAGAPQPIPVHEAMEAFQKRDVDRFGCGDAKDLYGMLCELSHPNGGTLIHYWEEHGQAILVKRPPPEPELAILNSDLVSLLVFVYELLEATQESTIRPVVKRCMDLAMEQKKAALRNARR